MLQRIIEFLRVLRGGSFSQAMAYQEAVKEAFQRDLLRNTVGFARATERVAGRNITVGIHRESGREIPVKFSFGDFLAHHLIQGRSGSGKSRYVESLIMQFLQSFPEVGIIVVDGKGELFDRVRMWIAALLYRRNEKERLRFLERVVIVDPFYASVLPPLNFCAPVSQYPAELLAEDLLGGLRRLFPENSITVRMEVALRHSLVALIEAGRAERSLSLLEARDLLAAEAFRERVLLRVRNEETRAYFSQDFPRESRGTIDAVKSRLSYLLLSEQVRLSFGTADCVQFRDAIEQGKVVLINLGKTLLATDTAREVMGTMVLSTFIRAVFSRPMNQGPYILGCADEFQNFIIPGIFERLYTEARAYRCFLTAICQQLAAQVPSRALREIILNNSRFVSCFSSNEQEAQSLGRVMFRPSGRLPKPSWRFSGKRAQRFYTENEELELLIRKIPSLPHRHFFFWDKESRFGAQLLSTRTVPEPHEFAGVSEEEFARFYEALDPLWSRMGRKREEVKKAIEERRRCWGIGAGQSLSSSDTPRLSRRAVLEKLEARLGKGKPGDKGVNGKG